MQKLLYYAQGCNLALDRGLLFDEPIIAWKHGPVVEEIYHTFKNYGESGIKFADLNEIYDPDKYDPDTCGILAQVYDVFGKYSAWQLRNMTHDEAPW